MKKTPLQPGDGNKEGPGQQLATGSAPVAVRPELYPAALEHEAPLLNEGAPGSLPFVQSSRGARYDASPPSATPSRVMDASAPLLRRRHDLEAQDGGERTPLIRQNGRRKLWFCGRVSMIVLGLLGLVWVIAFAIAYWRYEIFEGIGYEILC